jgi:hypothetical protein
MTWLLSFLSGPIISGLLDAYRAKLASVNTTDQHAVDLAVADLQAQIEERKGARALASTQLGIVQEFFGWISLAYYAKVIVWDKLLELGSTDPIKGDMSTVYMLIITFYFGAPIINNTVSRVLTRFGK